MIKRLLAALFVVWASMVWWYDDFASVAALFTFIPSQFTWIVTVALIALAGLAVYRILDFDNWGVEDAVSGLYLGSLALYSLTGSINAVLIELIKNFVGFSAAFLFGIWVARMSVGQNRRGGGRYA